MHMWDFTSRETPLTQSNRPNLNFLAVFLKRSCPLGLRNCKIRLKATISSFWCLRSQNQQSSLGVQRKGITMASGYGMMAVRGSLPSNWWFFAFELTCFGFKCGLRWSFPLEEKITIKATRLHENQTSPHQVKVCNGRVWSLGSFWWGYCPWSADLRRLLTSAFSASLLKPDWSWVIAK